MLEEPARGFLARQRVAHLATADAHGAPHVVPVCFVVLEATLYIAIDEKPKRGDGRSLRRLRNIASNPQVALVADEYDDRDWSRLGFVLVHARARLVEAAAERRRAIAALRGKYPQYVAMALEDRPLIAADVQRVTAWGTASRTAP
jgi:PPOX class probable F420-dependent enzyme